MSRILQGLMVGLCVVVTGCSGRVVKVGVENGASCGDAGTHVLARFLWKEALRSQQIG